MQQDFALDPVFEDGSKADGAIYDGRDTGTVVCPNADIKIFLTASLEIRAERRFKEFQEKGLDTPYETVYNDIKARDERDSSRKEAPLKPADDAVIIDTTKMNIPEMVQNTCEKVIDKWIANRN
jgi:cytidylate kinase